jgi:hypothetical protein
MPKKSKRQAAFVLPTETVVQLAELAGVPKTSHTLFGNLITQAIGEAHIDHAIVRGKLPKAQYSDVARELRLVGTPAKRLDATLKSLGDKDTNPRRWHAKVFAISLLPDWTDYRHCLKRLIADLSKAEQRARSAYPSLNRRGRPKGVGGNRAFDHFVKRLYEIARETGGRWKHYRDPHYRDPKVKWKGSLMTALKILKPHLPSRGFFPNAELGRSLEHLINQLRADTTKKATPP